MENNDVITDPGTREKNNRLVPIMIQRLRSLKKEAQENSEASQEAFKRPFSIFASNTAISTNNPVAKTTSPAKSIIRRTSFETEHGGK